MTANLKPLDDYGRCLRRLEAAQNLHCEATYHSSTPKTVIAATEKMLADAKADVGDSLVRLNEAILKGEL